ncbi:MAG: secretin N-terminal domain-containing protein, partial [Pirellulaceae bacterium]
LEREVVVVPEPVQNKLILSATPRYYDEIAQLIQRLDEQPPQVMIQVMIAEILLGNTDEFGIEMGIQDSVLFDRSLLGNLVTTTATTNTSTPAGVVTETTQDIVA